MSCDEIDKSCKEIIASSPQPNCDYRNEIVPELTNRVTGSLLPRSKVVMSLKKPVIINFSEVMRTL